MRNGQESERERAMRPNKKKVDDAIAKAILIKPRPNATRVIAASRSFSRIMYVRDKVLVGIRANPDTFDRQNVGGHPVRADEPPSSKVFSRTRVNHLVRPFLCSGVAQESKGP